MSEFLRQTERKITNSLQNPYRLRPPLTNQDCDKIKKYVAIRASSAKDTNIINNKCSSPLFLGNGKEYILYTCSKNINLIGENYIIEKWT